MTVQSMLNRQHNSCWISGHTCNLPVTFDCSGAFSHELIEPTWQEMHARVARFYHAAIAESTAGTYGKHAKYWARFCVLFGLQHEFRAPTEEGVCLLVAWLSLSNGHSTVRSAMSGIKYSWSSMSVQPDMSGLTQYYRVMKGMRPRERGMPKS